MSEITARLENWGEIWNQLYGDIYDDTKGRWRNGHTIKLSKNEIDVNILYEGDIIHTENSTYLLGRKINGGY